jgi:hypothetical protein
MKGAALPDVVRKMVVVGLRSFVGLCLFLSASQCEGKTNGFHVVEISAK